MAAKGQLGPACPACSCERSIPHATRPTIQTCTACGCLHGRCYLGDSYTLVMPYFDADTSFDGSAPFDLDCLGSQGLTRRHGWYRPSTRGLVQVG